MYTAIADPSRRRILELLRGGEQPAGWIAESFRVTRPAISQHLRVLLDAGLVTDRRVGRERRYRLDATRIRDVLMWCKQYELFWQERLTSLGRLLDHEQD